MSEIYRFNTDTVPQLWEVGAKAKALIELTGAGFDVPDGMALGVSFFEPWMEEVRSSPAWADVTGDEGAEATRENCDLLVSFASDLTFTNRQSDMLSEALGGIGEGKAGGIFAVRSSSPEEDLQGASFAGMYETYLGVTPKTLERHVAMAFASMFDFRVMQYKLQRKMDISDAKIAVIIQMQVASDVSGIGFSINPYDNCYDNVVINASFGLGEYIVSGKVTPDRYIVDVRTHCVTNRVISEKKAALLLEEGGGTRQVKPEHATAPALSHDQILELSALIKKCEAHYGFPVDVEWAYEGGRLYLLQARPVTAYFALYPELLTQPGERKELYLDMVKISQGFQESMSAMGSELFIKLLSVAKQGLITIGKQGFAYNIHGRTYLQIGNITKVIGKKSIIGMTGMIEPTVTRIMREQIDVSEYVPAKKSPLAKGYYSNAIKFSLKFLPNILKAYGDIETAVDKYFAFAEQCRQHLDENRNSEEPFSEQVEMMMRLYLEFANTAAAMMPAMVAQSTMIRMFKGKNVLSDVAMLSMDLKGNPTSQMGAAQFELACFAEFKNCASSDEFEQKLKNGGFSREFTGAYSDYMDRFGCRGIREIDIASTRTKENIPAFFNLLKQINVDDNTLSGIKKKRNDAYDRLRALAKTMHKEKKFIKIAKNLEWLGVREHPKYMFIYGVDMLRQNALRLAERFVAEGRLDETKDIFMLSIDIVTKAQQDGKIDIRALVNEERAARKLTQNVRQWPALFDSRGQVFTINREAKEGELKGEPVAPGIVIGRAKVLNAPFEKKLEQGEILVTMATEPSWTPIFINASGVVMEFGGALQHGAIIAREYGLPCVTGIQNATQIIKDGDLIEVDGTNGIVRML